MITFERPTFEGLRYICEHLRERDRAEIFATRYVETADALAADTLQCGDFQWMVCLDGVPVASIGAFPAVPNVWTVWAYGTDQWPRVVRALTKHVRRFMAPALMQTSAVRVHCFALKTHTEARNWLEALGARPEHELDNWGKNGQTFILYSWTREGVSGHVLGKWRRRKYPRNQHESRTDEPAGDDGLQRALA